MRISLVIISILLLLPSLSGQVTTKLVISSFEHFYHTIDVENESLLENRFRKERVEYVMNESGLHCSEYFRETHHNQYDGDSIVVEKTRTIPKRWKNSMSIEHFAELTKILGTESEPLGGVTHMLFTSHHRFYVYCRIIEDGDTTIWRKTKPFEPNTPWENFADDLMVVDAELDRMVSDLLPKRFNGRRKILSATR